MQQVEGGARFRDGAINKLLNLAESGLVICSSDARQSQVNFDRRQVLCKIMVELARNAAPFLVLHFQKLRGETTQDISRAADCAEPNIVWMVSGAFKPIHKCGTDGFRPSGATRSMRPKFPHVPGCGKSRTLFAGAPRATAAG